MKGLSVSTLIPVCCHGLLDILSTGQWPRVLWHQQLRVEVEHEVEGRHPLEGVAVHCASDGVTGEVEL